VPPHEAAESIGEHKERCEEGTTLGRVSLYKGSSLNRSVQTRAGPEQRRIIHFSSGDTLEQEDREEEQEEEEEEEEEEERTGLPSGWDSDKSVMLHPIFSRVICLHSLLLAGGGVPCLQAHVVCNAPQSEPCSASLPVSWDFLGERLAGAPGLDAAKYQHAADQLQRDQEATSNPGAPPVTRYFLCRKRADDPLRGLPRTSPPGHQQPGRGRAAERTGGHKTPLPWGEGSQSLRSRRGGGDEEHMETSDARHNTASQADGDCFK
ncbi:uncharacterized protein AB9W97_003137, partial [Spinachia spinachia]